MSAPRTNNFNLLRLVLALLVLLSHAAELADGDRSRELLTRVFHTVSCGELALDGFFLLSGFLIVQSWTCAPALGVFLRKRVLRIVPGFVVASLVCVLLVGPLGAGPGYLARLAPGAVLRDIALLQPPAVAGLFSGQPYPVLNGAMWTISLEFVSYLAVAALGLLGVTRRPFAWLALAGASIGAAFAQRAGLLHVATPAALDWTDGLVRLFAFFAAGGAFYLHRARLHQGWPWVLAAVAATALALFSWRLAELALATAGGYALLRLALAPIQALAWFNRLPDVSYGVYLYGWPVQKLYYWTFPHSSPWSAFAACAVCALALGAASWYGVEKPAMRWRARWPTLAAPAHGA